MAQVFKSIKIGVFIALVNFIIQGISFFVQNFIAKNLGTQDFGYFGILQTDYSIFCSIADFGMSTLILAYFGVNATRGTLFKNVLQLRVFTAMATAALMAVFALGFRRGHPVFYGELIMSFGLMFQHAFFDWYFICGKMWKKLFYSKLLHSISYSAVMGFSLLYLKLERIEYVALAMVLAALPAFFFGVTQALDFSFFRVTRRTFRFIFLMLKSGVPYALSSFASFAFIPAGLYVADKFATGDFLGAYNYGNKIILLCSGIMVHFISSSLVTQHTFRDKFIHVKDMLIFTGFIAVCSSPLWACPSQFLQMLFFAVDFDENTLGVGASILRILSFTLMFQAMRMSLISTLLKEKATWAYAIRITAAGAVNLLACVLAGMNLPDGYIPLFALTGDVALCVLLFAHFLRKGRIRW